MTPERRIENLCILLGMPLNSSPREVCDDIGVDVHEFLYEDAEIDDRGPSKQFLYGYKDACDDTCAMYLAGNQGKLQYWLGAVSAVQNHLQMPDDA